MVSRIFSPAGRQNRREQETERAPFVRKGRVIYYSVSLRRTFSFHGESIHESFLLIVFFLFRFFFFFFFHFTGSPFRPRLPPVSHKAKSGRQLPQTCPADQISASSHFARDGAAHDFADEPTTSSASRETRMGKKNEEEEDEERRWLVKTLPSFLVLFFLPPSSFFSFCFFIWKQRAHCLKFRGG